jgi:protein gp37
MRFDKSGDFIPKYYEKRMSQVLIEKPSTIFVCSMGDLLGEWVPSDWIRKVLLITARYHQHNFLFLTKNPSRYRGFPFPKNCWLGASTDTAYHASIFTEQLSAKRKTSRYNQTFISAEPLLEDIADYMDYDAVDWIIIGGLNRNLKPVPTEKGGTSIVWVMNLIREADKHNVPVFVKDGLCSQYPTLKKWRELPYLEGKVVGNGV